MFVRKEELKERSITFSGGIISSEPTTFPPNVVRNQKYSLISFVPIVLYEQFKFFFNMYFLIVALTQFIPRLQVGIIFFIALFNILKVFCLPTLLL
jgi:phospholipid-translocating ATPase